MKEFLKTLGVGALSALWVLLFILIGCGAVETFIAMNSASGWLAVVVFFLALIPLAGFILGIYTLGYAVILALKAAQKEREEAFDEVEHGK